MVGFAVHLIQPAAAAACTIDSSDIDRDQRKPFFICGESITDDYRLAGLAEADISIDYDQYLKRCTLADNRHGIFFWLAAAAAARTATLQVSNAAGEALCQPLPIDVPDRVPVGAATLTAAKEPGSAIHLLEIHAVNGEDFSQACADGIEFPAWGRTPSRWPTLNLVAASDIADAPRAFRRQKQALSCSDNTIRALVTVHGQQRESAKIVISNVKLASGQSAEGIAYVSLPEPSWANSMSDEDAKFVDVDGLRTRYWDQGQGPALLLVHGGQPSPGDSAALTWSRVFDGLSEQFHVYALDRIGQGRTDNPKTRDDYEHYRERVVEHVWGFINAVGIERFGLVGHSQGSWPVMRTALNHPDRTSCLVVVDGSTMAPRGGPPNLQTPRFYLYSSQFHPPEGATPESVRRTQELQSHTLNNLTEAGARRAYELSQLDKLAEAVAIIDEIGNSPQDPISAALFGQAHADIADGKLTVPTLVIWGYNDPSAPVSRGRLLFDLISAHTPVAQLHLFNDSGHASHVEHPQEFSRVVATFCGRY